MDAAQAVVQLQGITGMSPEEAQNFLAMAGGNLEGAVSLFFDMGGAVGGAPAPAPVPTGGWAPPDWFTFIWPEKKDIPPSWLEQGIQFSDKHNEKLGLLQPKNGPCGVLAAINAVIIAQAIVNHHPLLLDVAPDDLAIASAMAKIITNVRTSPTQACRLASWEGTVGQGVRLEDISAENLPQQLVKHMPNFRGRGGAILFLYSVVFTRGVQEIKADLARDGSEPPLVIGNNWLCTSDLVNLLLCGEAKGNVSAYSPNTQEKLKFLPTIYGVGLLSYGEIEAGIPVADELKSPQNPVFLLHGGDHFTVLFSIDGPIPTGPGEFTMYQWNGLPPSGPRMCKLHIKAVNGPAKPAADKHKDTYVKPETGEIDDVVQAHPEDRTRSKKWTTWRYEVVLAVDDPSVKGVERPPDQPPEPKFNLGEFSTGSSWRCASCYAKRYETMCFGQNDANTTHCQHCGKSPKEAGWSLWLNYNDLTPKARRLVNRRYAPKIVTLLRTKWPGCEVTWEPEDNPPSV